MIHLINVNPSIDRYLEINDFETLKTNQYKLIEQTLGGKAINSMKIISQYLTEYILVTALTIEAQNEAKEVLAKYNCHIYEDQKTRINFKINDNGQITELNEKVKNSIVIGQFCDYLKMLNANDIIVISGSLSSHDANKLTTVLETLKNRIIIDSTGFSLDQLIKIKPILIKPNIEEFEQLMNSQMSNQTLIIQSAKQLINHGLKSIIISQGKDGSIYIDKENKYKVTNLAKEQVINTVGAGDSYLAGFIIAMQKKMSIEQSLKFASAAGSATAYNLGIGQKSKIEKLIELVEVTKLK